ncbi:MAG: DUF2269 family protein [Mycobacteriales bacterium]|nr:DUF2269 family protein [Frankia sp.]
MFNARNVLLVLHIFAVAITLGPLLFFDWVVMGATKTGGENADTLRLVERVAAKLGPATASILLLGLILVFRSNADRLWFNRAWIDAAIALYVSLVVVGAGLLTSLIKKSIAKIDAGESVAPEHSKLVFFGIYNNVAALVILYLMVAKPGG